MTTPPACTSGAHHWLLEEAQPYPRLTAGRCRVCGAVRGFRSWLVQDYPEGQAGEAGQQGEADTAADSGSKQEDPQPTLMPQPRGERRRDDGGRWV